MRRNLPVFAVISVIPALLALTPFGAPAWGAPPAKKPQLSPRTAKDLESTLKASVEDSKAKLGKLESWQGELFDQEVLPQYRKFIRQYRQSGNQTLVDVDVEAIRKYLSFHGPTVLKTDKPTIAVFLSASEDCARCTEAASVMRKALTQKLERRGLKAAYIDSMPTEGVSVEEMSGALASMAQSRKQAGALLLRWEALPVDPAHPDEQHFQVRASISAFADEENELRTDAMLDISAAESFVGTAEELLTDAWTELGAKAIAYERGGRREGPGDSYGEGLNDPEDTLVVVSGIGDFAHYSEVRAQVSEKLTPVLADPSGLKIRRIKRGEVTFAVRTQQNAEGIRALLAPVLAPASRAPVGEASGAAAPIRLEVK